MSDLVIDHALICARATDLGMDAATFAERTGVRLADLEGLLRPELISVALLDKIATVLELDPGDLIIKSASAVEFDDADCADADVVEALLASREIISPAELAIVLVWRRGRVEAALNALSERFEGTPLRLVRTDDGISITHRLGVVAPDVRRRLEFWREGRAPLAPREAMILLGLVRADLRRPIDGNVSIESVDTADDLVRRRLAVRVTPPLRRGVELGIFTGQRALTAHPDVMFALRLVSEPEFDGPSPPVEVHAGEEPPSPDSVDFA
jgi:hypothetical protein